MNIAHRPSFSERLSALEQGLQSCLTQMTSTTTAGQKFPDAALRRHFRSEITFFNERTALMDTAECDAYKNIVQPLYANIQNLDNLLQREFQREEAPSGRHRHSNAEQRLKDIIKAEIERNNENFNVLSSNASQFSAVDEEQRVLEKSLHSASMHIRTLKKLKLTEDILERLAKALFVSVCLHICLSRLGVYWVLRLLGFQSISQHAIKINRTFFHYLLRQRGTFIRKFLTVYATPTVKLLCHLVTSTGAYGLDRLDAWTTAAMHFLLSPILFF